MENRQREIVGILLAAGAGSRFGGEKLLHPLPDGVAIGAHAARNLIAAGLTVVAVVKPGDFPLYDLFEQEGCRVTFCPDAARGMGASLAHGVESARNAGGWVIALGDMPRIQPGTIRRVVQALQEGAAIAAPAYQRRARPPGRFRRAISRRSDAALRRQRRARDPRASPAGHPAGRLRRSRRARTTSTARATSPAPHDST